MATRKHIKIERGIKLLIDKFREEFKCDAEITVEYLDTYYVECNGSAYATTEKKSKKAYVIQVAERQPVDLLLDCFAHELGHVAVYADLEVVCDYIARRLGRYH
jgi:hypothetical protein